MSSILAIIMRILLGGQGRGYGRHKPEGLLFRPSWSPWLRMRILFLWFVTAIVTPTSHGWTLHQYQRKRSKRAPWGSSSHVRRRMMTPLHEQHDDDGRRLDEKMEANCTSSSSSFSTRNRTTATTVVAEEFLQKLWGRAKNRKPETLHNNNNNKSPPQESRQGPFETVTRLVKSIIHNAAAATPNNNKDNDDHSGASILRPARTRTNSSSSVKQVIPSPYDQLYSRLLVLPLEKTQNKEQAKAEELPTDQTMTTTSTSSSSSPFLPSYQRYCFRLDIAYHGESFCGWQTQLTPSSSRSHFNQTQTNLKNSSGLTNNDNHTSALRPSVQQTLEDWLRPVAVTDKPRRNKKKKQQQQQYQYRYQHQPTERPPSVNLRSAGRTDAGVHSVGQVTRFRTWMTTRTTTSSTRRQDGDDDNNNGTSRLPLEQFLPDPQNEQNTSSSILYSHAIWNYVNSHPLAGKTFACLNVEPVSSQFHPTFGASCRAYLYVLDAKDLMSLLGNSTHESTTNQGHNNNNNNNSQLERLERFAARLNQLLRPLEGEPLDYLACSYGKVKTQNTTCTLMIARAFCATEIRKYTETGVSDNRLRNDEQDGNIIDMNKTALCIAVVGNRFLRRMVRILVATALRETVANSLHTAMNNDAGEWTDHDGNCLETNTTQNTLLEIIKSFDRRRAARPAPPQGLVFANALYEEDSL